jgi:hypothetical protein
VAGTVSSAHARFTALPVTVTVDGADAGSLGSLATLKGRLHDAGHVCQFAGYEHGVDIACLDGSGAPQVYLGLVYEPTRSPEFAEVSSVRIHGRNGGELAAAEWLGFLVKYSGARAKRFPLRNQTQSLQVEASGKC